MRELGVCDDGTVTRGCYCQSSHPRATLRRASGPRRGPASPRVSAANLNPPAGGQQPLAFNITGIHFGSESESDDRTHGGWTLLTHSRASRRLMIVT